jgi:hypothetical protein
MMTDPICLRSWHPAWIRRVTRSSAFVFAKGASAERYGVLTEDTDDATGFRLSLSLPCTTPRVVVE